MTGARERNRAEAADSAEPGGRGSKLDGLQVRDLRSVTSVLATYASILKRLLSHGPGFNLGANEASYGFATPRSPQSRHAKVSSIPGSAEKGP